MLKRSCPRSLKAVDFRSSLLAFTGAGAYSTGAGAYFTGAGAYFTGASSYFTGTSAYSTGVERLLYRRRKCGVHCRGSRTFHYNQLFMEAFYEKEAS
jgi:hypothetical protein